MNRINQLRMIAAGVFCIGVLMGGVGTGIAFADFSGFSYQAVKAPQEEMETETFTYEIAPEDEERIWVRGHLYDQKCMIVEQEDVPENLVEVEVVYNPELCQPYMETQENAEETYLALYLDFYGSDMGRMMKYKDQFLEGLKERELREFQVSYVERVEYHINPVNKGRLCTIN